MGVASPQRREEIFAGFDGAPPLFYATREGGVPAYRTSPNRLEYFNDQSFPVHKPAGTFRIFAFGESTTYGEPWGLRGSFSRYLRDALLRRGGRPIEVVNAGGKGYGSTAIVRLVREALRYEPDAFVFYVGHNEFREAAFHPAERAGRRVVPAWHAALYNHCRTYAALWNLARTHLPRRGAPRPTSFATQEVSRILSRPFGPSSFAFPSRLGIPPVAPPEGAPSPVLDDFERNLNTMLQLAVDKNVPCFVFTVTRNEGFWLVPNRSVFLPGADAFYEERYRALLTSVGEGRYDAALPQADSVAALYRVDGDDYLKVLRGDLNLMLGRPRDAEAAYRSAWLPDLVNDRIRGAASRNGATILEARPAARAVAPDSILGFSVFYDELHPTPEVHRALGELAAAALAPAPIGETPAGSGGAGPRDGAPSPLPGDPDGEVWAYESLRAMYLDRWEEAESAAQKALEMAPRLGKASVYLGICAARRGDMKKAREAWDRLARLYPEYAVTSTSER